ncbi:MAG TPA: cysteine rich repeat-containing protein, partial [Acetobacteraceae bacterium]|nr:cysteine rich repeat-containing protein [Acetobacteraceae bacterium]
TAATLRMGLGALLLTVPISAAAQQPTQAQANAIRQSCRSDYQSYCANVPTGGSAALACLQQNAASVSQPCQQALAAIGGGGTPQANPQAYGAGPPPGAAAPGTVPPSPAPPTGTARPPLTPREQMAVLRADCGRDYRVFCRGVPFGGGRAIGCLRANGPQLSPQCQSALLAMKQAR